MQWISVYKDGSSLMQYDGANESNHTQENKYKDIDRANLSHFLLVDDTDLNNIKVKIQLHLYEGQTLIYRRRILKSVVEGQELVNPDGSPISTDHVIYLVGYKEKGKEPVIMYYYPEIDKIELDHSRNNLELVKEEKSTYPSLKIEGGVNNSI